MNLNQNRTPLVSVIIPTYNHAQFIGKAIESVLCQSYNNLELIVVDNYSTDNTKEEIQSFQNDRILYYPFRNDGIIAASRNFGVDKANGEIIAFIDSDDEWHQEKLSLQVGHLNEDGIKCVATDFVPFGNVVMWRNHLKFRKGDSYRDYSYDDIVIQNPVVNSSAILYKSTFIDSGRLDEDPEFVAFEDWDLWLRACGKGKIRIINKVLVKYRLHSGNTRDKRDVHSRSIKLLNKHKNIGLIDNKLYNVAYGSRSLMLAKANLDANDSDCIKHYAIAYWYTKGFQNKLRSLVGIILFMLPSSVKKWVINLLHNMSKVIQNKIYQKW